MAEVIVRRAIPEDAPSLQAAIDRVAGEERWLGRARAPALDAVQTALASADEPYYVAVHGARVVGWCNNLRRPAASRCHCAALSMGLLPDHRGTGLGRRMLEMALEQADRVGIERVELDVLDDNRAAIRLYQRAGFVQEGHRRGGWRLAGRTRDMILMARFAPGIQNG